MSTKKLHVLTPKTSRNQPEEYHSAAMQHLESFLGSESESDQAGFGGGLEELQAVLLLAGFALLRPVGMLTFTIPVRTFLARVFDDTSSCYLESVGLVSRLDGGTNATLKSCVLSSIVVP